MGKQSTGRAGGIGRHYPRSLEPRSWPIHTILSPFLSSSPCLSPWVALSALTSSPRGFQK